MFKSIILQSVSKWLFRKKFPVTQRQKLCREHREETRQLNLTQTLAYGKALERTPREPVLAFLVKGASLSSFWSHHQKVGGILYKAELMACAFDSHRTFEMLGSYCPPCLCLLYPPYIFFLPPPESPLSSFTDHLLSESTTFCTTECPLCVMLKLHTHWFYFAVRLPT